MSENIMELSAQHSSRRPEERHLSLPALLAVAEGFKASAKQAIVKLADMSAAPVAGSPNGLALVSPAGNPLVPTNWAFRQFCQKVQAPAAFLASLPGDLAADTLNHQIAKYAGDYKAQALVSTDAGAMELRALTGPDYGRVWNAEIVKALIGAVGDGVTGRYRVPGIRGKALDRVTSETTTIFGSEEDCYIMLADEQNPIEMPGRRDGKPTRLHRGFIISNSEVGKLKLRVKMFLFDVVCANRIIWNAEQIEEVSIRHSSGAPGRWVEAVLPQIDKMGQASAKTVLEPIMAAKKHLLPERNLADAFLMEFFDKSQIEGIHVAHVTDERRPIENAWDCVVGATAYARGIEFTDARMEIESAAGEIIEAVR